MKCKKTVSGKHFWEDIIHGWKGSINSTIGMMPETYYRKCIACGIIDDTVREFGDNYEGKKADN